VRTASDVVLLKTGDWTQVYVNGRKTGWGNHMLSDQEWAGVLEEAQPIESITTREFITKPDEDYWPYLHDWPEDLLDIPEGELLEPYVLMKSQGLRLGDEPAGQVSPL
jgi:hypothetical protein